jgi:hypothetical protein
MSNPSAQTRSIAILSGVLCLPFAAIFTLLITHIEPNFGPVQPLLNNPNPDQPDVPGSLIVLGTLLLVIAAFIINLLPILRSVRSGGSIAAHPVNLIFAILTLADILWVFGSMILDQYPCWIGVPNCD